MPAPVINEVRPYTGYKRKEPFQFSLAAAPLPLRWGAYSLPAGITVDDPADFACTAVASTDVLTATGNDFANGDAVYFTALTGGSGLVVNTPYYVRDKASDTFKLAATKSGLAINIGTDISDAVIRKVSTGVFSSEGIDLNTQYLLNVWAENADGTGTAVIPVCISPEVYIAPASGAIEEVGLPLTIDVVTRAVRVGKPGETATTTTTAAEVTPLFTVTQGDTRFLVIYFERAGVQIDPDPEALAIALKEEELDPTLVEADEFEKAGSGSAARFYLPLDLNKRKLAAALSNYESDSFVAKFEIQWKQETTFKGDPLILPSSSQKFLVQIVGEYIKNA